MNPNVCVYLQSFFNTTIFQTFTSEDEWETSSAIAIKFVFITIFMLIKLWIFY